MNKPKFYEKGCIYCGYQGELRFGGCFDCANMESLFIDGETMYEDCSDWNKKEVLMYVIRKSMTRNAEVKISAKYNKAIEDKQDWVMRALVGKLCQALLGVLLLMIAIQSEHIVIVVLLTIGGLVNSIQGVHGMIKFHKELERNHKNIKGDE